MWTALPTAVITAEGRACLERVRDGGLLPWGPDTLLLR